jgi:dipeptidyl aminopeptidase/acylaminoacyl peptidase
VSLAASAPARAGSRRSRRAPTGGVWSQPLPARRVRCGACPFDGARAEISRATRIALTTGSGSAPRLGADYLVYVSSKGTGDSLWKLQGGIASELWSAPDARIIGRPAIAPNGRRVAFSIRQRERTSLIVANADGTEARAVGGALHLQGAPAWTPDGRAITVAAVADDVPRLFTIPLDGRPPASLVQEYSVDPAWSPDGEFVAFSGPDIGTTFEVKAVTPEGRPYPLRGLTLTRGSRYLRPLPDRRLIVLRGEIGHKNLWLIDLATGAEQQLTHVAPDFDVRDFDVSADGREIVLEQVHEQSDIVLIDIPQSG